MKNNTHVPFLVIGSGIAGMSTALHLSKLGKVILCTKSKLISGSSPLAQGGIAGVINKNDSFESHIQDTMNAGRNTNNKKAVELLVHQAPEEIQFLENLGVRFEKDQHLEGGHSFPRVSNSKDISGKIIIETLAFNILANRNISIMENTELCKIDAQNKSISSRSNNTNNVNRIFAEYIIVATGGYSSLYQDSTSPKENMGDGISLCINAGIATKDLDKVQFHPTVLNKKRENKPQLLLTEAIRGFGAKIIDKNGKEIIDALQPRDIVSKAIYYEEKKQKSKNCVFLDARNIKNFSTKFPFIANILETEFALNAEKNLLPITFGAHYCMGGIKTNIWGETSTPDIYAVGECAHTGVHGNNRLASNSLLEGLVFARQIAKSISNKIKNKNKKYSENRIYKENKNETVYDESEEKYAQYNSEFLETIKNSLSQYLSIEENKIKKLENIQIVQKIFKDLEKNNYKLSYRNKNILTLVQRLAKDAENNV